MGDIITNYINQILGILLLAFFGFLGVQCKNLYKRYVNTEVKQAVCRTAVRFVEQVYRDLHGPEKLAEAMAKASEILAGYGISISEAELVAMIEAAVNEFNKSFGTGSKAKLPEAETNTSYRPELDGAGILNETDSYISKH